MRSQAPDQKLALSGEARDGKVRFQYTLDVQGQTLTVVYAGTLAARKVEGTVDAQGFGASGTFSAVPAPAKP